MTPTPDQRQMFRWLLIAATLMGVVWLLAPVLTPFIVAAVLAYALHPAVEALVARRVPRTLSVTMVVLLALLGVLSLLLLIIPILSKEIPLLKAQIPLLAERLNQHLTPLLAQYGVQVQLDVAGIKAMALKFFDGNLEDGLATLLSSARIGGSVVLSLLGNLVLVPMVLFYLLLDWSPSVERVRRFVPPRFQARTDAFLAECDDVLGQYLRGQLAVMLALALYYTVALKLAGFELALPVGIFTGLAIFIPYLGFGLGAVLALLAGLLQFTGWWGVGAVALVYGLGQVLESFVLTPRLVGERIGLSPLAVIFALLAFGHLFGFVGVLIALPVSAVLLVALRRVKVTYLNSELYRG
ncbi:AI-2E family transporter [Ideonella paludis]|uniref:AI-2E family transporter n=1 Tax=Ideonella paludis TaxID=1233411 RepID=A0ABS5E0K0_9BURK|nr:AI-2E family transporter [Ideonella paludis]MBQ0936930.1 AI-2E family transporter [Ideonella paludis]